jgi:hypothetical protein
VNDDGSESPQGSSLDGFDHKVVLKKGHESDVSALSDDETPNHVADVVAARKAVEYAETVGDKYEQAVFGKAKKPSKEEKEAAKALADKEKELKAAAKKLKEDEKAREKELAKSEKELAAAQKELAGEEKPKKKAPKEKEEKPKEEKAKEEKPKKEKKEKAPKEEKEKTPKGRPAASKRKESPKAAVLEKEDSEDETEDIVIDGEEYALVGNNVFDEDGTLVGTKVDGKIEWSEESIRGKAHMNR